MPEIKNNFLKSRMNKDLDPRLLQQGEYRDALNIHIIAGETNNSGSASNIKGNTNISNIGSNDGFVTIGGCFDEQEDRIIWFSTNNESHYIFMLDINSYESNPSGYTPFVLASGSYLNLNKDFLITGVNTIDDLLFWNDNNNQPRRLDIAKALVNSSYYINASEDKISVAKYSPYQAPILDMSNDTTINGDYIYDKFVRFSYRYKFLNNEYSQLAPFSQIAFETDGNQLTADEVSELYKKGIIDKVINNINKVDITVPLPTDAIDNYEIKSVDIILKDSNSTAARIIKTINVSTTDQTNEYVSYSYKSDQPNLTLPGDQVTRVTDNVPVRAKAQEIAGNRLILGNYTQYKDLPDLDYEVFYSPKNADIFYGDGATTDFTLTKTPVDINDIIAYIDNAVATVSAYNAGSKTITLSAAPSDGSQIAVVLASELSSYDYKYHSVKQRRSYDIGVVLADKYGRKSSVIVSNTSSLEVLAKGDTFDSRLWNGDALNVKFNSVIADAYDEVSNPLGWYSYRIVVKQPEQEFYNAYLPGIGNYGRSNSYINLFGDNINKIPRDTTNVGADGLATSLVRVYPKVINTSIYYTSPKPFDVVEGSAVGYSYDISYEPYFGQNITAYISNYISPSMQTYGFGDLTISGNQATLDLSQDNSLNGSVVEYPAGNVVPNNVHVFVNGLYYPVGSNNKYTYSAGGATYGQITFLEGYVPVSGDDINVFVEYASVQITASAGSGVTETVTSLGQLSSYSTYGGMTITKGDAQNIDLSVSVKDAYIDNYSLSYNYQLQSDANILKISNIGTVSSFDNIDLDLLNTSSEIQLYKTGINSVLAELQYNGDYEFIYNEGASGLSGMAVDLAVFETEPTVSALDIYYETSTTGLVSELNALITALPYPSLTSGTFSNIATDSFDINATLNDVDASPISEVGFYISTINNINTATKYVVSTSQVEGSIFTKTFDSLLPDTTYYIWGYATNNTGTKLLSAQSTKTTALATYSPNPTGFSIGKTDGIIVDGTINSGGTINSVSAYGWVEGNTVQTDTSRGISINYTVNSTYANAGTYNTIIYVTQPAYASFMPTYNSAWAVSCSGAISQGALYDGSSLITVKRYSPASFTSSTAGTTVYVTAYYDIPSGYSGEGNESSINIPIAQESGITKNSNEIGTINVVAGGGQKTYDLNQYFNNATSFYAVSPDSSFTVNVAGSDLTVTPASSCTADSGSITKSMTIYGYGCGGSNASMNVYLSISGCDQSTQTYTNTFNIVNNITGSGNTSIGQVSYISTEVSDVWNYAQFEVYDQTGDPLTANSITGIGVSSSSSLGGVVEFVEILTLSTGRAQVRIRHKKITGGQNITITINGSVGASYSSTMYVTNNMTGATRVDGFGSSTIFTGKFNETIEQTSTYTFSGSLCSAPTVSVSNVSGVIVSASWSTSGSQHILTVSVKISSQNNTSFNITLNGGIGFPLNTSTKMFNVIKQYSTNNGANWTTYNGSAIFMNATDTSLWIKQTQTSTPYYQYYNTMGSTPIGMEPINFSPSTSYLSSCNNNATIFKYSCSANTTSKYKGKYINCGGFPILVQQASTA